MDKVIALILGGFVIAFMIIVIGLLFAYPVMWLWNGCLVGTVDGVHQIDSVWTAFGINVLCGFLFKSSSSSK